MGDAKKARALDTIDKIAKWDYKEMQQMFVDFVERTGFDGSPPTPSEAAFAVKLARYLPRIVEYQPAKAQTIRVISGEQK